jgi:hypothetical protein
VTNFTLAGSEFVLVCPCPNTAAESKTNANVRIAGFISQHCNSEAKKMKWTFVTLGALFNRTLYRRAKTLCPPKGSVYLRLIRYGSGNFG